MQASKAYCLCLLLSLAGCDETVPFDKPPPAVLSDWNLLEVQDRNLILKNDALPYDLNTPLFSDYAHKLRTVWMPDERQARLTATGDFELPPGTVLTKTFYYPEFDGVLSKVAGDSVFVDESLNLDAVRLIETRILVRRVGGWEALPYVWNERETEAVLSIAGAIEPVSLDDVKFNYVVPTKNECASCHAMNHTTAVIEPIGLKARHLNKVFQYYRKGPANQLAHWQDHGYLDAMTDVSQLPQAVPWPAREGDSIASQARSYLDINCGHCHNPVGPADTSGLFLHAGETSLRRLGVCKRPIAAGHGTGGRAVSIQPGDKERSILYFRMASRDPAEMMPELGRSLVHAEGLALVGQWIDELNVSCPPPAS